MGMSENVVEPPRRALRSNTKMRIDDQMEEATGLWNVPLPSTSKNVKLRPSMNEPCYQKLLEMNQKSLIENFESFNCVLCRMFIRKGKGVILKDCFHSFCQPCLVRVIKNNPVGFYGQVNCPNLLDKCESKISAEEIKALLGDEHAEFLHKNVNSTEALIPMLLDMDDLEVFPNFQAFTCQICFNDVGNGDGILLKNCLHNGCKECLAELIQHADEFDVKCPHVENNISCNNNIDEKEMRFLVSKEIFEKHLKKSLKIAEHVNELNFHCRGINCENFVELEENILTFTCNACGVVNCVKCKAVHPGKSCQDYQEEANPELKDARLKNENMESEATIAAEVAAGISMLCPRCSIPVMKVTGCDFITCTACKLGICWVTRKPRKSFKRGNGEEVEGCKCREAPDLLKKCHPKCGNCH